MAVSMGSSLIYGGQEEQFVCRRLAAMPVHVELLTPSPAVELKALVVIGLRTRERDGS